MVSFLPYKRNQLHINHDGKKPPVVRCQSSSPTFRLPWLMKPIAFMDDCFQRVVANTIAYFVFPFLLDDLETVAPIIPEPAEVNSPKVHTTGPDILMICLAILWLRRKPQDCRQQEEKQQVSKSLFQLLYTWNSSLYGPSLHMFPCQHFQPVCECCNHRLRVPPCPERPHCKGCFQTMKWDPKLYSPSCPYKDEDTLFYNYPLHSERVCPLSVYHLKHESIQTEYEKTLDKLGDETNSGTIWSTEDDSPPSSDEEEEVEIWDEVDEQGSKIEQSMDLKRTVAKSGRRNCKARKALKPIKPKVSKTMRPRILRHESLLDRL